MTSTVTEITRDFLGSRPYLSQSDWVDAIAVVLLILLLAEVEVIRAYAGDRAQPRVRLFAVAIAPLILAFALITFVRSFGLR
jgi:hypothetical protein